VKQGVEPGAHGRGSWQMTNVNPYCICTSDNGVAHLSEQLSMAPPRL
jgi:hypothetical protein